MGIIIEVHNVGKSSVHFKAYQPPGGFWISKTDMKNSIGYEDTEKGLNHVGKEITMWESFVYKYYIYKDRRQDGKMCRLKVSIDEGV